MFLDIQDCHLPRFPLREGYRHPEINGGLEKAIKTLQTAVSLGSGHPEAHFNFNCSRQGGIAD
jgi:hypothetical protein